MKKLLFCIICIVAASASAKQNYYSMLLQAYPNTKIHDRVKCQACHGNSGLNTYGKDFVRKIKKPGFTADNYHALDDVDSDGDGFDNLQEILQGFNPGLKSDFPSIRE